MFESARGMKYLEFEPDRSVHLNFNLGMPVSRAGERRTSVSEDSDVKCRALELKKKSSNDEQQVFWIFIYFHIPYTRYSPWTTNQK